MKNNEYIDELREMAGIDEDETEEESVEDAQPEEPLDMEGSVECKIKMRKKDMRHFMFHHTYSKFSGWFGVLISMAALAMIIIGRDKYSGAEIAILSVLALMFTVLRPIQIVLQANRQVSRQAMFLNPIYYNICKDGIVVRQDEQFANVLWSQVRNVVETGKAIFVYTSPVMAFILPKDQLDNAGEVAGLLKKNVKK